MAITYTVAVDLHIELPDDLEEQVRRRREALDEAQLTQRQAAELSRSLARKLTAQMSMRDAAKVLGVQHARIQQLVHSCDNRAA